jgi:hypothetical protein
MVQDVARGAIAVNHTVCFQFLKNRLELSFGNMLYVLPNRGCDDAQRLFIVGKKLGDKITTGLVQVLEYLDLICESFFFVRARKAFANGTVRGTRYSGSLRVFEKLHTVGQQ